MAEPIRHHRRCPYHARLWRLIDGFRYTPVVRHQRGRVINAVAETYDIEPLRRLAGLAAAHDDAVEAADYDKVDQCLATFDASFPTLAEETIGLLADPFNTAAARYAPGVAAGRPGLELGAAGTLLDLWVIRRFFAIFGVTAEGPTPLEMCTRYCTLNTADPGPGLLQVALNGHLRYTGYWARLLRQPEVVDLRWRSITDQTTHIAELSGAARDATGGGTVTLGGRGCDALAPPLDTPAVSGLLSPPGAAGQTV